MNKCFAHKDHLYIMYMKYPQRPEEGGTTLEAELPDACDLLVWVLGLTLQVLLTTKYILK